MVSTGVALLIATCDLLESAHGKVVATPANVVVKNRTENLRMKVLDTVTFGVPGRT